MKHKHVIAYTVLLAAFLPAMAWAESPKAEIEVRYNARSYFVNGKERGQTYHLLANQMYSKYFSPKSGQIDSFTSTPEGEAKFKQSQQAAMEAMMASGVIDISRMPRKTENIYVVKSSADSVMTVYEMLGDDGVVYDEPLSEMTWEIGDSTRTIMGYDCVAAYTDYHGRRWTAWFAPDIPIADGPWKFHGLPGLILEVTETTGLGFFADGIEKSDKPIVKVYGESKYSKADRKEILRARRASMDNPNGRLAAKGIRGVMVTENPALLTKPGDKTDFLETDYR